MWWLFIFVSTAVASILPNQSYSSDGVNGTIDSLPESADLDLLKSKLDEIMDDYLKYFAAAQSQPAPKRRRRHVSEKDKANLLIDSTGAYRLQALKPILSTCAPALKMEFINVFNDTYVVCLSATKGEEVPAMVHLGHITPSSYNEIESWYVSNPEDVALLYDNGILNILVADSKKEKGVDLYQYSFSENKISLDHTVHGSHPTAISIWKMKVDGTYHMAVANSGGDKNSADLTTSVYMYNWMGTYFDKYAEIIGYDVKDIEPFHIHGAAYLAIANFRRGKNDFKIDSEIFKYNLDQNRWLSVQKIRTYQAMDFEFFALGQGTGKEFFLAVANYAKSNEQTAASVIYKFVKDTFVPFQCLETYGATSISTVSGEQKFLLAIANNDILHLYQYDGWRFMEASVQYTQKLSWGVNDLSFHYIGNNGTLVLAISDTDPKYYGEHSIYEVTFVHDKSLEQWYRESEDWCRRKLDNLNNPTVTGLEDIQDIFFVDQPDPIILRGDVNFDGGLEAAKISTPLFLNTNDNMAYDNSILLKLKDLNSRLQKASEQIKIIQNVFDHALKLEGEQVVNAHYDFQDVAFECENSSCIFNDITTTMLNGEDISNLRENIIFLNEDNAINQPLSVENINAAEINVDGLVDGMDTRNLVTKTGNHEITGHKTFKNKIRATELQVNGLIDNVKLATENVLLRTGFQNITGKLNFADINTEWLDVTNSVNGCNLKKFYDDLVLTEGNYVITGKKHFKDASIANLQITPRSKINNVDIVDLYKNALWINGSQEITAPMKFSSVIFEKDLYIEDINGIRIPGDRVLLIDENAEINEPQTFTETAIVSKLFVNNSINGIYVDKSTGLLDVLLKNGEQVITGQKTFDTIVLEGNSIVGGKIDGVNINELYASSLRHNSPVQSDHVWTFNNLLIEGPLTVGGSIAGINISDIYEKSLKLNETNLPNLVLQGPVSIENLESHNINGIDISEDFVQVGKKQIITGTKTFRNIILKEDSYTNGLVNNVNLSFLSDTLLRIGNQKIVSKKIFNGDVKFGKLTVKGCINDISVDELVTLNGDEVISGMKTFANLKANNIVVENLEIDGLINGINIDDMIKDTLTYNGNQHITGTKTITGVLQIANASNLQTNSLNNVDIYSLWNDAVLVDVPQTISGHKTFAAPVSFEDIWVEGDIDGVTEWDMKYNWMLQGVDQIVEGDVTFLSNVEAGVVTVNGLVNGINITELNETIVKVDEPAYIQGPVIFDGKVVSNGDVTLTGKIGGIDLSEEAILRTKESIIIGEKTFENDIVVEGNLNVEGLIDQVKIEDMCKNIIRLDQAEELKNLVIVGDAVFESGSTVTGLLSGVNVTSLNVATVKSDDAETHMTGIKTFDTLTIEGALTVVGGNFGGIDLRDLEDNYMSVSKDQDILVTHTFEEIYANGSLYTNNFYTNDELLNGINITQLDESVLKTSGFQKITAEHVYEDAVFDDDVMVVGKVNGLEIPKEVMKRNRTNYINSPKIFTRTVSVLGDLQMEKDTKVQGINLGEWAEKVVKKNYGSYKIGGFKTFQDISAQDIVVDGLIDGVKVSDETLLLTYKDQEVTGKMYISGDVNILGNLTVGGLINDVNLNDLANRAVRRDSDNTITGFKTFKKPLLVHELTANSINGVDLRDLQKRVEGNMDSDFNELSDKLIELEDVIAEMQTAVDRQAVILQYYELFQSFVKPMAYSWLYVRTLNKEFLLLSQFAVTDTGCTHVEVYEYDNDNSFVRTSQVLESSKALAMKTLNVWESTLVVIANSNPNENCFDPHPMINETSDSDGDTRINIYYYESRSNTFKPYQSLMARSAADLALFEDGDHVCFVYLEMVDTKLYCSSDALHVFKYIETLHTVGGRKVSIINHQNSIMMAIASVNDNNRQYVDIYFWNKITMRFGEPRQYIRSTQADSVLFMKQTYGRSMEIFLLIAEGTIPLINNVPRLFVYKYDEELQSFSKYQIIEDSGELDWVLLPTGELMFFVLDVKTGKIKYYSYKGAAGFVLSDSIKSVGTQTLHVFTRNTSEDRMNHYLALAGIHNTAPHVRNDPYPAKILKSKMQGEILPMY